MSTTFYEFPNLSGDMDNLLKGLVILRLKGSNVTDKAVRSTLTVLFMVASVILIIVAPEDRVLGLSQKIFYPHVSCAWVAMLAFFVNFIGSIVYLSGKKLKWDKFAAASAEIGVFFCVIVLVSGSIWAKIAWGVWWTWDVRLTTTLILLLTYLGYLLVRMMANDEKKSVFSAVIGIVAFTDVPLVFISIRWWRSIHPAVITRSGMNLEPLMTVTLFVSLAAMTLFYVFLLMSRVKGKSR